MKKRGMELTISTLVVIILGLLMLTMGSVLIRNTYCKAIQGVDLISKIGIEEINRLFQEQEENVAVKDEENDIQKNVYFGVAFFVRNDIENTNFKYNISAIDTQDCKIDKKTAESYIVTGKSSTFTLNSGDIHKDLIEFKIPKDAPICSLKYSINVYNGGVFYGSSVFQVRIKETKFVSSLFC